MTDWPLWAHLALGALVVLTVLGLLIAVVVLLTRAEAWEADDAEEWHR